MLVMLMSTFQNFNTFLQSYRTLSSQFSHENNNLSNRFDIKALKAYHAIPDLSIYFWT